MKQVHAWVKVMKVFECLISGILPSDATVDVDIFHHKLQTHRDHNQRPTFCRRHVKMHFLNGYIWSFNKILLKVVPESLIDNKSALVVADADRWQATAWTNEVPQDHMSSLNFNHLILWYPSPSHHTNQSWPVINWKIQNKLQWRLGSKYKCFLWRRCVSRWPLTPQTYLMEIPELHHILLKGTLEIK